MNTQEYEINVTKERIVEAFENLPFLEFKKFIPKPKFYGEKKWTVWFIKEMKNMKVPALKDDIAILTTLITQLRKTYFCLWQPWRTPQTRIDESFFMPDFIKEAYNSMALEQIRIDYENKTDQNNPELLLKYFETLYGYFLAEKMIASVDDAYLKCTFWGYPICTRLNSSDGQLWLRYNNISVRGSRRVKMWDTFLTNHSSYSRRAAPGRFYNLYPESMKVLEELEYDEDRVPFLLRQKAKMDTQCEYVDAIHPHISNASPCLGGWESKLINVASKGYSELFFKAIRGFLCTWSRESPFWNINQQYYATYTLYDSKKEKDVKAHWSPVDSMFITKCHPALFSETHRHRALCAKILCSQRIDYGIYTSTTINILKRVIKDIKRTTRSHLLSKLHDIPYKYVDDEKIKAQYLMNPYLMLEDFTMNSYSFPLSRESSSSCRIVMLDRKKSNLDFRSIIDRVLTRTASIVDELWFEVLNEMSYTDILTYAKDSFEKKYITLEKVKAYYISNWMHWLESLTEEEQLMHNYTISEEKDNLILQLIINPEFAMKQIAEWKAQSISSTLDKVNKEKEEYVSELTHMSNHSEQGQLFSG